jgi:hypothetical protein
MNSTIKDTIKLALVVFAVAAFFWLGTAGLALVVSLALEAVK